MAIFARLYDTGGQNRENPLAWPLLATTEELRGQVPHVIVVQELDPLRDQGGLERKAWGFGGGGG